MYVATIFCLLTYPDTLPDLPDVGSHGHLALEPLPKHKEVAAADFMRSPLSPKSSWDRNVAC